MSGSNSTTRSCILPIRAHTCFGALTRGRELWRQVSSPLTLGLLGLAIAVTLWGYGYKLSLYYASTGDAAPRVPVAKLWIEHRFGFDGLSSSATAPKVNARIYAHPGTFALFLAAPEFSLRGVPGVLPVAAVPRSTPFFHAAIPLRSPPPPISL